MLPRRLYYRPSTNADASADGKGLYMQISVALLAVFFLALLTGFATEALSFITPHGTLAIVP